MPAGAVAGRPTVRPGSNLPSSPGYPGRPGNGRSPLPVDDGATGIFPPGSVAPPTRGQSPTGYNPEPGRSRPPARPVRPKRFIDYPRWGRTGFTRWLPSWKLISAFIGTGILIVMAGLFAAYTATDLPPIDALAKAQTTLITFNDKKTPIDEVATQNRQSVSITQIPEHLQNAVLAAEDRSFRTNSGVDPTSIARAVWSNLRGNSLQGGSTISQQYIKNVYDQRDRSYKRKAKEFFLAVKINQKLDKDKILEDYLNTIYLGRNSYGMQAASQSYFGRDVEKLNVSQSAFLAGIINAPSLADPRGGADEKARAERRWGVVLDAMVTEKWLDPTERAGLKFPATIKPSASVTLKGQNGFLKDMVMKEAQEKLGLTEDQLLTGGYNITTTFNSRMMNAGVRAVKEMLPAKKERPSGLNIGMASIDPKTGAVRAIYGGPQYNGPSTNNATLARAQGGSTFKAFGLIAALEAGYSLKTQYQSSSPVTVGGKKFRNTEDGESDGFQDLVVGTKKSLNTIYVQLNEDVGPAKMADAAHTAGIPADVKIARDELGNVLGSADPRAVDMASAYSTFASGGVRHVPYTIQRVTKIGSKKEVFNATDDNALDGKQVFDSDTVADLTYALQQVIGPGGTGTYASRLPFPVAGKTGTSSDSRSAWFAGYTPQLATAVMMYQVKEIEVDGKKVFSNVPMKGFGTHPNSIFGGGYPLEIWTAYMEDAMKGKKLEEFPLRADTGEIKHRAPVIVKPTQPAQTQAPTQDPNPTITKRPDPTQTVEEPNPTFTLPSSQPTRTRPPPDPTTDPTAPDNGSGGQ